jgi:hypothetical protein
MNLFINLIAVLLFVSIFDENGNKVDIDVQNNYLLVLFDGVVCKNCALTIDSIITSKANRKFHYDILINSNKNMIEKKVEKHQYAENFKPDNFYFYNNLNELINFPKINEVQNYPSIILIYNKTVTILKYEEIFSRKQSPVIILDSIIKCLNY